MPARRWDRVGRSAIGRRLVNLSYMWLAGGGVVDHVGGGDIGAGAVGGEGGAHDGSGIDGQGGADAANVRDVIVAVTDYVEFTAGGEGAGDGIVVLGGEAAAAEFASEDLAVKVDGGVAAALTPHKASRKLYYCVMAQSHREASRRLFEIAEQQQGFFTPKQAKAAGFAENTHPYHVQVGNWVREYRGIYRLALFPVTDRPDLVLWALWSRNRNEEIEGVYSHHTVLSFYDLSDLNPAKLHMTVPASFRRSSEIPGVLVLHYADLPESDVETVQGFKITRPLRAILDLIEAGTVEQNFIRQAITQGVDRGLITRPEVRSRQMSEPARRIFEEVLRRAA
jgi:hypothetical protein